MTPLRLRPADDTDRLLRAVFPDPLTRLLRAMSDECYRDTGAPGVHPREVARLLEAGRRLDRWSLRWNARPCLTVDPTSRRRARARRAELAARRDRDQ